MNKKVLIIDDDPAIRLAIKNLMQLEGYDVNTVGDAQQAISRVFAYRPDVIILDYMLSGFDGCEICKQFRMYRATRDIPVIMISAHDKPIKCFKIAGANDFLAKPFDIQELLDKVSYFLH